MPHGAKKCYQTKDCAVEGLSNKCRTNGSHPEPFCASYFFDGQKCPRIRKSTSQVTKYTSESDTRDESENSLIAYLILPETRYWKHLNNIEDEGIEDDTRESKKNHLTGNFPTIHFCKNITKNI